MFSVGRSLFNMISEKAGADAPPPTFGRPMPISEMATSLSDDDSKWKLTNIGGIGSDEDKELRAKAAQSEQEFEGAGQQPGLEIWRIEKFEPNKLEEIRADNISLYSGDSYIVLKTTQKEDSDALDWQLHYWIGKDSTQDESGAAAYFTVNIDDLLEQKAVQHREVQYSESALFHSYFKSVTYLDGGIESGFRKAEPEVYKSRLLQMTKTGGSVRVVEVPLSSASLNDGDVFILDAGMQIYQFNSTNSNVFERSRAMEIINQDIQVERNYEAELTVIDGEEIFTCEPFWELLGGKVDELPSAEDGAALARQPTVTDDVDFASLKTLARITSDDEDCEDGELVFSVVKKDADELSAQDDIDDQDVWAVSCDNQAFFYIGEKASIDEKLYVKNCADAIVDRLGLSEGSPVTFFSKSSNADVWNQLFV